MLVQRPKRRALLRAVAGEGGAAVTAGAGIVAVGGLLMGIGFVEVSIGPKPIDALASPWLVGGLVVSVSGLAMMLGSFLLIVHRHFLNEWWRYQLSDAIQAGNDFLTKMHAGTDATQEQVDNWERRTYKVLRERDPSGSLGVRFKNEYGITAQSPALPVNVSPVRYAFLYCRLVRLGEFLREAPPV
jgi:hypothetical protein